MKYEVTLLKTELKKVDDRYETVVKTVQKFNYRSLEDLQLLFGIMVEGSDGSIVFRIDKSEETEEA